MDDQAYMVQLHVAGIFNLAKEQRLIWTPQ